jgi:hypothetical protein
VGHVAHIGKTLNVCRVVIGKFGRERQLGRPRHSWKDKIKIILNEMK